MALKAGPLFCPCHRAKWLLTRPVPPVGSGQPNLLPHPFQHFLHVVAELHEQVDFPAGVTIDRVHLRSKRARSRSRDKGKNGKRRENNSPAPLYLLAASVVSQLVVAGVQGLPGVHGVQDDFVSHDYLGSKMGKGRARMRPGAPWGTEPWH